MCHFSNLFLCVQGDGWSIGGSVRTLLGDGSPSRAGILSRLHILGYSVELPDATSHTVRVPEYSQGLIEFVQDC